MLIHILYNIVTSLLYIYMCRNSSDALLYAILYFQKVMRSPLKRSNIKLHHLMRLLWLLLQSTLVSSSTGSKFKLLDYVSNFPGEQCEHLSSGEGKNCG